MENETTIQELYDEAKEQNKVMLEALENIFELALDSVGECISISAEALDFVRPILGGE